MLTVWRILNVAAKATKAVSDAVERLKQPRELLSRAADAAVELVGSIIERAQRRSVTVDSAAASDERDWASVSAAAAPLVRPSQSACCHTQPWAERTSAHGWRPMPDFGTWRTKLVLGVARPHAAADAIASMGANLWRTSAVGPRQPAERGAPTPKLDLFLYLTAAGPQRAPPSSSRRTS